MKVLSSKVLTFKSFIPQNFYLSKVLPIKSFILATSQKFYPTKFLHLESFTAQNFS